MAIVQKSLLNSLIVRKGIGGSEGKRIAVWDAVGECSRSACTLHLDCPYLLQIESVNKSSPCLVQSNYVKYVFDSIVVANVDKLSQMQMDQIGFHLLPLYQHLIKFKMVEFSLTTMGDIAERNLRTGGLTIHPVYKEIRDTLKHIDSLWSSIGINKDLKIERPKTPSLEDMFEHGDPSYADKLVSGRFSNDPSLDEFERDSLPPKVEKPVRKEKIEKEQNAMIRRRRPKKTRIIE